jgi:hypothetical protein
MRSGELMELPGALVAVSLAWGVLRVAEVPAAMRVVGRMADRIVGRVSARAADAEERGRVQRALFRASRLVPGSDCKERALGGRLLLAWRGVRSQVVVGFRREDGRWEGHAWLELEAGGRLFMETSGGCREVFREELL